MLLFLPLLLLLEWPKVSGVDRKKVEAVEHILSECNDIVYPAKEKPLDDGVYTVYSRCRLHHRRDASVGILGGCHELANLYAVARHYNDKAGVVLTSEDFCATAAERGSSSAKIAVDGDPMKELTTCIAGVEEVLSSPEMGEAAERACHRAHPSAADAPIACRAYMQALAKAPRDSLVDAESLCSQLIARRRNGENGSEGTSQDSNENAFVASCVQFASSLIADPGSSERDVRQSCEAHIPSRDASFCLDFSKLVKSRADHSQLASFCSSQYRAINAAKTSSRQHVLQPPQAQSTLARASIGEGVTKPTSAGSDSAASALTTHGLLDMGAVCGRIFDKVIRVGLRGDVVETVSSQLCATEFRAVPLRHRPKEAKIQIGCRYFAKHFAQRSRQQGRATDATGFCRELVGQRQAPEPSPPVPQLKVSASIRRNIPNPAPTAQQVKISPSTGKVPESTPKQQVMVNKQDAQAFDDFMNKFLNHYEAPDSTLVAPDAQGQSLSTAIFAASTQVAPAAPIAPPSPTAYVAKPAPANPAEQVAPAALAAPAAPVTEVTPAKLAEQAAPGVPKGVAVAHAAPATAAAPATPAATGLAAPLDTVEQQAMPESSVGHSGEVNDFLSNFMTEYVRADSSVAVTQAPAAPIMIQATEPIPAAKESGDTDVDGLVMNFLARRI